MISIWTLSQVHFALLDCRQIMSFSFVRFFRWSIIKRNRIGYSLCWPLPMLSDLLVNGYNGYIRMWLRDWQLAISRRCLRLMHALPGWSRSQRLQPLWVTFWITLAWPSICALFFYVELFNQSLSPGLTCYANIMLTIWDTLTSMSLILPKGLGMFGLLPMVLGSILRI